MCVLNPKATLLIVVLCKDHSVLKIGVNAGSLLYLIALQ